MQKVTAPQKDNRAGHIGYIKSLTKINDHGTLFLNTHINKWRIHEINRTVS